MAMNKQRHSDQPGAFMSTRDVVEAVPTAQFVLYFDGDRYAVGTEVPEGAREISTCTAASWTEARLIFSTQLQAAQDAERAAAVGASGPAEPGVFKSAHEALVFAFNYAGQQSPKTPMSIMLQQARPLGNGRGLSGLDGAAQAGMVLAALKGLSDEQRNVIIARYGNIRRPCNCCGQMAPDAAWRDAVDALSLCDGLRDLPKAVRHAAIEAAVCRKKQRFADYATEYGLSTRTLRHKLKEVRDRYAAVENAALAWLEDHFGGRGVLVEQQ